ncbi:MAG TPA: hypothetical protein VJJ24_01705 [Candidatus Paceibacterota bacterium]
MANVLPQEEKATLYKAYQRRVLVLSLGLLSALVLASIVMLIPSLVIFSVKKETVTKQLEFLKQSEQVKVTGDAIEEIKLTRERVKLLSADKTIPMSVRLNEVISKRPAGIFVDSIIIPSPLLIEIRGEAKTREDMLSFVKLLEESSYVEKVDSPISNLINSQDGQFLVRISTKTEI